MKEKIKQGIESFVSAFVVGAGLMLGMLAIAALF